MMVAGRRAAGQGGVQRRSGMAAIGAVAWRGVAVG